MLVDSHPQRIVSLVPSMTESLFDLGFGQYVVGITDYCVHPKTELDNLPRLGGTKTPRVEDIIRLHPDLVIGNQEENGQQAILALRDSGIPIWLTFPKTIEGAISDLWSLARLFHSETANSKLRMIEKVVDYARLAVVDQSPVRYFCPIWYENDQVGNPWWMTFNQDTYSNDLLSLLGLKNVFAERVRRYPIAADFGLVDPEPPDDRDIRYPRVKLQDVIAARADVILFPDEPYPFGEDDSRQFHAVYLAATDIDIPSLLFEGSYITWPGTRIARALTELAPEFTKLTKGIDSDKL